MTQWKIMFSAVCAVALLGLAGSASAQAPTSVAPDSGAARGAPAVSAPATGGGSYRSGGSYRGGGGYRGGGYRHHGGYDRHHRGGYGYGAGFATGLILGGAAAGPYYYGYYDAPGYDDDEPVYEGGYDGDAVAYCRSRFKSYDPASGTYLGYDGMRHPCP